MAFDLRLLQSPPFGEMAEPFGSKQVGSSAMPFKRNPINSEKIGSLARFVAALPAVAWQNAATCLLERTLDDSANRRVILAEGFLAIDEILNTELRIVRGWRVVAEAIDRNLANYGVFAASEALLMEMVKAGARPPGHARAHSTAQPGGRGPPCSAASPIHWRRCCRRTIRSSPIVLPAATVLKLLDAQDYVGDAPQRARDFASALRARLEAAKQ